MTTQSASASGKIILSGEYAVVFGKQGIAIPSELKMKITLEKGQKNDGLTILWNQKDVDEGWYAYTQKIADRIAKRVKPVSGTLTIDNALPLGKGMGSSTALIIAMCRCMIGPDSAKIALAIENEMNPGNSGIDFAVIWGEKPILFSKGNVPEIIDLSADLLRGMKLIDTGKPGEPTPELVAWVKKRYEADEPGIHEAIDIIGHCTERILTGEALKNVMHDHHCAQVTLGIVPENAQTIIADIEKNGGAAKVIGAGGRTGGGGMVLVLE